MNVREFDSWDWQGCYCNVQRQCTLWINWLACGVNSPTPTDTDSSSIFTVWVMQCGYLELQMSVHVSINMFYSLQEGVSKRCLSKSRPHFLLSWSTSRKKQRLITTYRMYLQQFIVTQFVKNSPHLISLHTGALHLSLSCSEVPIVMLLAVIGLLSKARSAMIYVCSYSG